MGFGQGLSGLNAASQTLDVIGNNIANSGTVGFKSATASFADVYANSRVGLGTQVSGINQRFTVGTISGTGNQFDMAIDGAKGMFRVIDTSGNVLYTRNGQFFADKDNNIVNAQGQRLTGYIGGSTAPQPIKVPVGNIAPFATNTIATEANLDANADIVPGATTFNVADPDSYTHMLPITVYDSLGNSHELSQYFVKREPEVAPHADAGLSKWEVYYQIDGNPVTSPASETMIFEKNGTLKSPTGQVTISVTGVGGAGSPAEGLGISLSYDGTTQFGGEFSKSFTQNGFPTGEYASMSIATDGSIVANYTNGEKQTFGTLVLADFNNLQGLQPVGGNAWAETSASGQPTLGAPGTNSMASIKGQAVEESNVDMSVELVNMIIAQRTYQANAQTIKTQDQVLQTLINLR